MKRPNLALSALAAGLLLFASPATAQHKHDHGHTGHEAKAAEAGTAAFGAITISGAYARASIGQAPTSAVYMTVSIAEGADRLISAATDAAEAVELHTTSMANDVMKMEQVENIPVSADEPAELAPGGYHVMLIGLVEPLKEGSEIPVTLTFEGAGEVSMIVPVKRVRHGGHGDHGSHGKAHGSGS